MLREEELVRCLLLKVRRFASVAPGNAVSLRCFLPPSLYGALLREKGEDLYCGVRFLRDDDIESGEIRLGWEALVVECGGCGKPLRTDSDRAVFVVGGRKMRCLRCACGWDDSAKRAAVIEKALSRDRK
jgi:hypothetical protein